MTLSQCTYTNKENKTINHSDFHIVGAMKNVMWKGELGSSIDLDTLSDKKGLYGLGPESYLTGELLINDGRTYVSRVVSDSSMSVEETDQVSAPFFVYANVNEWTAIDLPSDIKSISDLEEFINRKMSEIKEPFALKLKGEVNHAEIHVQNLAKGSKVSSPEEAHRGQVNYNLGETQVEIVGFFSRNHQGVFTHHDSFLHLHLITEDKSQMGHLDAMEIKNMQLFLPKG